MVVLSAKNTHHVSASGNLIIVFRASYHHDAVIYIPPLTVSPTPLS
jgi:hypothetical protein